MKVRELCLWCTFVGRETIPSESRWGKVSHLFFIFSSMLVVHAVWNSPLVLCSTINLLGFFMDGERIILSQTSKPFDLLSFRDQGRHRAWSGRTDESRQRVSLIMMNGPSDGVHISFVVAYWPEPSCPVDLTPLLKQPKQIHMHNHQIDPYSPNRWCRYLDHFLETNVIPIILPLWKHMAEI